MWCVREKDTKEGHKVFLPKQLEVWNCYQNEEDCVKRNFLKGEEVQELEHVKYEIPIRHPRGDIK